MNDINYTFPHTPGPWVAYHELLTPNGLHAPGRAPMVRADHHIIALVGRFWDERLSKAVCQEAESNARFISQAPLMEAYIFGRARSGDRDAQALLEVINATVMKDP